MNDAAVWQVAWRKSAPRVVLFALRAPSLFVLNVRRCDRCTCALCRLRTRNRSSPLRCFPLWCPAGNPASPEGAHIASPQAPPPSSPLPRASLPCDCPILRPRAGLLLSRACDFPFAMSFGATYAHASPLILAARCWLLHICAETRQAPFKLAAACGPISLCCRISHAA
jgi:hypothetical protein